MLFKRVGSCLCTDMEHIVNNRINRIQAIADTGCTTTCVHLESLSKLLGVTSVEVLDTLMRISGESVHSVVIANNTEVSVIPVVLHNVTIDGSLFPWFKCTVQLPSVVPTKCLDCESYVKAQYATGRPYILIGLDILSKFGTCTLCDNVLKCDCFDYELYNKEVDLWKNRYARLYQVHEDSGSGIGKLLEQASCD